ncbi:MAG: sensor histidine kinase [Spirochaetales bacterium]|nr:sensor histidine kinase [Spirochaetales bacterium]
MKRILTRRKRKKKDTVIIILLFSLIGILGTYTGIPVHGAIANSRVVGVFVAGLIGGPVIGLATGLIAGFHRWVIDIGGFTAFACMLSTILEGLIGGLLHRQISKAEKKWFFATGFGAGAELLQMMLILAIVRPFRDAVELVQLIALPMIGANAVAIGLFIAIIENVREKEDLVAANQAETVLLIALQTIEHFRKGYNRETATASARIILEKTDLSAVAFTNREIILAHVGTGATHHPPGEPFQTRLTGKVLETGKLLVAGNSREINCLNSGCSLQSAVVTPLYRGNEIVGVMKLYRNEPRAISRVDMNLATGLGALFSNQIELSTIEEQAKLLGKAELKALQAQINPHFLFNAINTISSLIRTDPDSARKLLKNLSHIFRKSLQTGQEDVSIEQELDHIEAYLNIEKARYGDNLKVEIKKPQELHFNLPPLILQPLVENAVKHGIMARKEGGIILIDIRGDRKNIHIAIKDNGVGMPDRIIEKLLTEGDGSSIALYNINQRLVMKYGDKQGLKVESRQGKGTKVSLCIPR